MSDFDLAQALDLLSKSLAVVVSVVGLIIAINQLTLPAILRNREKWLRVALEGESNEHRRAVLRSLLDQVTARPVAGLLFPKRFYLEAGFWLIVAPVQVFGWTRTNPNWWGVVVAVVISLFALSTPIRRAIRLLAERARFIQDYLDGRDEVRLPRTSMLAQMEGGTRREFTYANLLALSVNLLAAGASLVILDLIVAGLIVAAVGLAGIGVLLGVVRKYITSRATIDGPWPKDHGQKP